MKPRSSLSAKSAFGATTSSKSSSAPKLNLWSNGQPGASVPVVTRSGSASQPPL